MTKSPSVKGFVDPYPSAPRNIVYPRSFWIGQRLVMHFQQLWIKKPVKTPRKMSKEKKPRMSHIRYLNNYFYSSYIPKIV